MLAASQAALSHCNTTLLILRYLITCPHSQITNRSLRCVASVISTPTRSSRLLYDFYVALTQCHIGSTCKVPLCCTAACLIEAGAPFAQAREAAAAGAGPGSGGDVGAPEGYVYDEGSGYYYSAESGLYWDAASGGFYSGEHQKWYSFDQETQQYVEWPEAGASGDGPAGTDGEDAMVEGDASEVAAEDGGEGAT